MDRNADLTQKTRSVLLNGLDTINKRTQKQFGGSYVH